MRLTGNRNSHQHGGSNETPDPDRPRPVAGLDRGADKLDDIIASGTLRCARCLDARRWGRATRTTIRSASTSITATISPRALGVKAEIVETPFPERIPALMSG